MILTIKRPSKVATFRGRFLGIVVLVVVQFINGIVHTVIGFTALLDSYVPGAFVSIEALIFNYYTLFFGILTILFTYLFWTGKRLGWIGTVTISLSAILVDVLSLFDLINVPRISKNAGIVGIPFNLLILVYVLQYHVRSKYHI